MQHLNTEAGCILIIILPAKIGKSNHLICRNQDKPAKDRDSGFKKLLPVQSAPCLLQGDDNPIRNIVVAKPIQLLLSTGLV